MELAHSVRPTIDNCVCFMTSSLYNFINIEAVKLWDILDLNHFLNRDPTLRVVCTDGELGIVIECS